MKKLIPIILFALVLVAGCDNSSEPENTSTYVRISGKILDWSLGGNHSITYNFDSPYNTDLGISASSSPISLSGEFDLVFHIEPDSSLLQILDAFPFTTWGDYFGTPSKIDVSPSDGKIAIARLMINQKDESKSLKWGPAYISGADTIYAGFIYANKDINITGSDIVPTNRAPFIIYTYNV
ncbi:MAG TPA: hypothetical protein VHO28_16615, partial [Ignavibacteriales bacterium]|nr:hypothetical protein [Ignavibacteriales bacterium]